VDAQSHVVKRAQGGSDFDLDRLVALCPRCHAQTDAPYARGRLVITPHGDGRFICEVIRGADKWAIQAEPAGSPARMNESGWSEVPVRFRLVLSGPVPSCTR
jgi:hypothetical protein